MTPSFPTRRSSDLKILSGTRRYHSVLATLLHWITVTIIMAPSHQRWRQNMRKPRDFDSELKSLADKAKQLKERRVRDLGALVTATGADAPDADELAGALLAAAANTDTATGEGWRKGGAAFFQGQSPDTADGTRHPPTRNPSPP